MWGRHQTEGGPVSNPIISDPEAPAAHYPTWPLTTGLCSRFSFPGAVISVNCLPVLWVVPFQVQVGGLCLLLKFAMLLPQLGPRRPTVRRAWVPAGRRGCFGCGARAVPTGGAARVPRTPPKHHLPGTRGLLSVLLLYPHTTLFGRCRPSLLTRYQELTGGQSK